MSLIQLCERGFIPDVLTRFGIRRLCKDRLREESAGDVVARQQARVAELRTSPIAIETAAANEQHYEVPARFFELCLGKRLKYSSCYYPSGDETLDQAEEAMLQLYLERAQLADGQRILELGCGWGSLTLWMAEHYPRARITGVSNSHSQREFILARAQARGLSNVEILTCDVNRLELPAAEFDRCVSIEMFEHMRNYQTLLANVARWLKDDGKLFVHIFCHRELAYPFETEGEDNWMGKYFFTGGLMPAFDTFRQFNEHLVVETDWRVNGRHYERTANHWLQNTDRHKDAIIAEFARVYGEKDAKLWWQRWRMFYMACAELFGYRNGEEWLVGHYRFVKKAG